MATPLGLRTVTVHKDVPANTEMVFGRQQGNILYTEVTNATAGVVDFTVNHFPENTGVPAVSIPILPSTTRAIPMTLYKYKASGVVTVVAYGM
jgi:hypothetical protein